MAERLSYPSNSLLEKGDMKVEVQDLPRLRAMVKYSHLELISKRGEILNKNEPEAN